MTAPVREGRGGAVLEIKVQPKGSRSNIGPVVEGRLKIAVTEPPDKGKANKAVVKLLAKKLTLAPSRLEIISGETSRKKSVLITGMSAKEVAARLQTCDV